MPRCKQTGTVTRARYTALKLGELSSVDKPAQIGALATIMKRADDIVEKDAGGAIKWLKKAIALHRKHMSGKAPTTGDEGVKSQQTMMDQMEKALAELEGGDVESGMSSMSKLRGSPSILAMSVAKYVDSDAGAHTFDEVLQANVFDEKIWPMTSALSQSIRSIMADKNLKPADKETKVTESVDEFLAAVRDISPGTEKRLAELISKKDDTMNWEQIAKDAQAELATAKARVTELEGQLTTEKAAHAETQKAMATATDEVIKVDDTTEVRKSVVGDAQFAVFKAMDRRTQMAELTKRADDEYGAIVGKAEDKALVLKHAATMDEPTRKAFDAIMSSAQQMASKSFDRLGGGGGLDPVSDVGKARTDFAGKVAEIEKRDGISNFKAMQKARTEFPDEFAAAYPDQAGNA